MAKCMNDPNQNMGMPKSKVVIHVGNIGRIIGKSIYFCVKCYFFWMIGKIVLGF